MLKSKTKVLVTGSEGQLGKCLQEKELNYPHLAFTFVSRKALDVTNAKRVSSYFVENSFDYCINCAAYTAVDLAEKQSELAYLVNAEGVKNLALACLKNKVVLIHISTDYVFDGKKGAPYDTDDKPNPINAYGASKLKGELYIQEILNEYFIVRTSWLYSEFGKNFYTSILKKAKANEALKIIAAETGCPTHAHNLGEFILKEIIRNHKKPPGLYHFCDGEEMTWFDFAEKILSDHNLTGKVTLEKTSQYQSLAARPKYSVLKMKKI